MLQRTRAALEAALRFIGIHSQQRELLAVNPALGHREVQVVLRPEQTSQLHLVQQRLPRSGRPAQ